MNVGQIERSVMNEWTPEQFDTLLNLYFKGDHSEVGLSKYFGTTIKAINRQIELIWYSESATKIFKYKPTAVREKRHGTKFIGKDMEVILKHHERGIGLEKTALILQRGVKEIADWKEKNNLSVSTRLKFPSRPSQGLGKRGIKETRTGFDLERKIDGKPRKVKQVVSSIDSVGKYLVLAVCDDGTLWQLDGLYEGAPFWEPFPTPPLFDT